jgi:hypothetical protein
VGEKVQVIVVGLLSLRAAYGPRSSRRMRSVAHGVRVSGRTAAIAAVSASLLVAAGLPAVAAPAAPARLAATPSPTAGGATQPTGPLSRPDQAQAMQLAAQSKQRVEISNARTESMALYANPNGTVSVEASDGPRWVQRSRTVHGKAESYWVDLDPTLVKNADGSLAPTALTSGLVLSGGGGTTVASMSKNGRTLSVSLPAGGGTVSVLPAPVLSGPTATYSEVRPGIDLVVTATGSGLETSWLLKRRPTGPLSLDLPVEVAGLTPNPTVDGSVDYTDGSGKPAARLGSAVMFDGSGKDPDTGEPRRRRDVTGQNGAVTSSPPSPSQGPAARSRHTVTYTPDPAWLADPATVFPVTVDPAGNWVEGNDTVASSNSSTTQWSAPTLKVGRDSAGVLHRSYVIASAGMNSALSGKLVTNAYLQAFVTYTSTCSTASNTAVQTYQSSATPGSTMVWSSKPGRSATGASTVFVPPHAVTGGCPTNVPPGTGAAYDNIDVTSIVNGWAQGSFSSTTVELAGDEATASSYKTFNSGDAATGKPTFYATYDTRPGVPTGLSPANGASIPSTTFTGTATVTDPDGGTAAAVLYLQDTTTANSWVTPSTGFQCTSVAVNTASTCSWPGLTNGHTYRWSAAAIDPSGYASAASAWQSFTVDTTPPAVPTVSSTAYPAGSWNPATPTAGTFAFSSASGAAATFRYWFNTAAPATVAATGTSPRTASVSLTPPVGADVLHVQAVDAAGNASNEATYSFGAGIAVTSPSDGGRTQANLLLGAVAPTTAGKVTFAYQLTTATAWTTIPPADVTLNGNPVVESPPGQWQVATTNDAFKAAAPANLVWNVAKTLGAVDNAIRVQATFTTAAGGAVGSTANSVTVVVDRQAFGDAYATAGIGPGKVSLGTGAYAVESTDASVAGFGSDLTIKRTFTSFNPTVTGPFGPGWVATLANDTAGSSWSGLTDAGSFATVKADDGSGSVFVQKADGTYAATADAAGAGLTLAKTGTDTGATFTLTDVDGTATTFKYLSGKVGSNPPTANAAWTFRFDAVTVPTAIGNLSMTSSTIFDGTLGSPTFGYPIRFTAPLTSTSQCTDSDFGVGCRAVKFFYTNPQGTSGYGKVSYISEMYNVGSGIQYTNLACYSYDTNGRLAQEWDPRVTSQNCGTPVLPVTYTYVTTAGPNNGKIASVTPPGLAAWNIGYTPGTGVDPYTGRLDTVSRTHNAANGSSTETATVRYGVPSGPPGGTGEANPGLLRLDGCPVGPERCRRHRNGCVLARRQCLGHGSSRRGRDRTRRERATGEHRRVLRDRATRVADHHQRVRHPRQHRPLAHPR